MKKPSQTRYVPKPSDEIYSRYRVNHRTFGDHAYLELGFVVSRNTHALHAAKRKRDYALKSFCT